MERFRTFTVLIGKISRSIRRIKSEVMKEYGLKIPHVSCLYYLYNNGALTAKELSDTCDEDKASLSRAIDQLEKMGLIFCDSDSPKRYKAHLCLTPKGEELAREISKKVNEALDYVGACLDDKERVSFYTALERISERLDGFYEKFD